MTILRGDCIEVMRTLDAESIDAIVTDPPYGLSFMGRPWDDLGELHEFGKWCEQWAREAYRVLKPGGHLLAFGGSRTYHRLASGIEDAGFEIRDQLMWVYASGFPKSLDVSKAIDKAAGAEREVVGDKLDRPGYHLHGHDGGEAFGHGLSSSTPETRAKAATITAPATDAAREWSGWGTALKPAHEPIVLARKPFAGTVAANVQAHGTGALNIDGCRVSWGKDKPTQEEWNRAGSSGAPGANGYAGQFSVGMKGAYADGLIPVPPGRWPANVVLTDPVFDGGWDGVVGGGDAGGGYGIRGRGGRVYGGGSGYTTEMPDTGQIVGYGDSGTYSRFFLVTKAPRRERVLSDGRRSPHPTQKPEELIRHLVRLVTPPGGIVLDPFLGSGTLGVVCEALGFRWLGIEREEEYADWARDRIRDRAPEWEEMC